MKKKLNFITFLIGVAIGFSFINSEEISMLKASMSENFIDGQDYARKAKTESLINRIFFLNLESASSKNLPSEFLNKKSEEMASARINQIMIKVPVEVESGLGILFDFLFSLAMFAGVIMAIFNFLKIIFAVNKAIIFEWINVKRLRRMGIGLVIMFIASAIIVTNQNYIALKVIEIENYDIINSAYDGIILMLGMISFLVAEIFAMGLKLKEEQDLTI